MHDGDINYSKYTLRELEEALAGIDEHLFPKNYANLRSAYERLKSTHTSHAPADHPIAPQGVNIQGEEELEKLTRRGFYCLVMGVGAFLAYFNSIYRWAMPPEYDRIKGAWLGPILPALDPYLPQTVIALGVGNIGYAAYCFYRYRTISKSGG